MLVSSDTMEIIGMCDRVVVVRDGRIVGTLEKPDITEVNIMRMAVGGSTEPPPHPVVARMAGGPGE